MLIERYLFQPPPAIPCGGFTLSADCGHTFKAQLHQGSKREVILYAHGNADDLVTAAPMAKALTELGYSVMIYDYCGYGDLAQTSPCEACCYACAEASLNYLFSRWSSQQIVLWGCSLGAGPTSWLAMRYQVAAVVLQSPFLSVRALVQERIGRWTKLVGCFERLGFPIVEYAKHIGCPTLVMHGTLDTIVPVSHGQELADITKATRWFPKCDHNDMELDPEFWRIVQQFLKTTLT